MALLLGFTKILGLLASYTADPSLFLLLIDLTLRIFFLASSLPLADPLLLEVSYITSPKSEFLTVLGDFKFK